MIETELLLLNKIPELAEKTGQSAESLTQQYVDAEGRNEVVMVGYISKENRKKILKNLPLVVEVNGALGITEKDFLAHLGNQVDRVAKRRTDELNDWIRSQEVRLS